MIKPNNIAINVGYGKETIFGDLSNIRKNSENLNEVRVGLIFP